MPDPKLSTSANRVDPYKNFKFRVESNGVYVAGVSKIGGLKRTTEVVEHREGGDPSIVRSSPGQSKFEAITLERLVTHDTDFHQWAGKVWNHDNVGTNAPQGSTSSNVSDSSDRRKDITIQVFNEAGQQVQAYKLFGCWVSDYQALPDLNAGANAIIIQHIKLENEGWELDLSIQAPTPSSI